MTDTTPAAGATRLTDESESLLIPTCSTHR